MRLIVLSLDAGPSSGRLSVAVLRSPEFTLPSSPRRVSYVTARLLLYPGPPRVPVSLLRRPFRMDERRAEPDSTGAGPVTLYGEFTLVGNRKVRCAVSLTEKELIVQRLTSSPVERNKIVLSLKDCVGCRAYRDDDSADPAAFLAAYFYPLKRRWASSGVSRQRVEQRFRLAALQDPRANQEEAEKWARAVRERSARQQYLRDGERSLATGVRRSRSCRRATVSPLITQLITVELHLTLQGC